MTTPSVVVENLSFQYRRGTHPSLRAIALTVDHAELLLVAGGSGSGKSTLLRCLNGLIPRSYQGNLEGRVQINGHDLTNLQLAQLAQEVGTLLQDPERQIVASVVERQAAFGPENLGWPKAKIQQAAAHALERLGIAHLATRETQHLSGGERQKVALAGVLSMQPGVLLLDEPLASLDPASAREVLHLFRQLADQGQTILLVEHRVEDVLAARPDRAVYMADGQATYNGPIAGFLDFADPAEVRLPVRALDSSPFRPAVTPGDPLIEIDDVHFAYGDGPPILRGASLTIHQGEVVAILGPNGAGKSTLLRQSIGLLRPQRGRVRVGGTDASRLTTAQLARTVGYVFQSPSHMLFAPTVRDELSFGPRNLGIPMAQINAQLDEALERVRLPVGLDQAPFSLSYGQQKRLSIAAVLAMKPRVLVLDEPTAGQDHANTIALMHTIGHLAGLEATVLITHDVDLAIRYATRVVLMREGTIVADGRPQEVLSNRALLEHCRIVPTSLLESVWSAVV